MSNLEKHILDSNVSQGSKILYYLYRRRGQWVSMPRLWRASGAFAVHSRVADLRREGHAIENRTTQSGREKHSEYRLV